MARCLPTKTVTTQSTALRSASVAHWLPIAEYEVGVSRAYNAHALVEIHKFWRRPSRLERSCSKCRALPSPKSRDWCATFCWLGHGPYSVRGV